MTPEEFHDDYWKKHLSVPNRLEALPFTVTEELLNMLDEKRTPTIGWWRRKTKESV